MGPSSLLQRRLKNIKLLMKTMQKSEKLTPAKDLSSVLVLFEDDRARRDAVKLCDAVINRFWTDHEFEVSWCPFESLTDPEAAQDSLTKATRADLLIVAAGDHLPREIKSWIDQWVRQRGEREGALIDVRGCTETAPCDTQLFLRTIAHRAGMDYLTQVPQTLSWCIPNSPDSYTQRAHTVTSLLHEILRH
jgi:hypothetical protein